LITGNILGGATEKLLDAIANPAELRDNLLLGPKMKRAGGHPAAHSHSISR
jgi:hypothetical protein